LNQSEVEQLVVGAMDVWNRAGPSTVLKYGGTSSNYTTNNIHMLWCMPGSGGDQWHWPAGIRAGMPCGTTKPMAISKYDCPNIDACSRCTSAATCQAQTCTPLDWSAVFQPQSNQYRWDLLKSMVHEFGHVFRLNHSATLDSTMYVTAYDENYPGRDPDYWHRAKQRYLRQDDIEGLWWEYLFMNSTVATRIDYAPASLTGYSQRTNPAWRSASTQAIAFKYPSTYVVAFRDHTRDQGNVKYATSYDAGSTWFAPSIVPGSSITRTSPALAFDQNINMVVLSASAAASTLDRIQANIQCQNGTWESYVINSGAPTRRPICPLLSRCPPMILASSRGIAGLSQHGSTVNR
jgi:hypothetical protein